MSLMPPSTPPEWGIVLQNACVDLGGKPVLDTISLHLHERRIGIIGQNGSGKSTLLRLMAGLIKPSKGCVRVDNLDPLRARRALLSHLGILFQNPDRQILFPTVGEELSFGLTQKGESMAAAREIVLAHLTGEGRAGWMDASISELSQGQRHWLCLQAVLLMRPDTLLLDEPFAGLDLPTQYRLGRMFAALPQRVITITHDPQSLWQADRVIWLAEGRVVADGRPSEIIPRFIDTMEALGKADANANLTC